MASVYGSQVLRSMTHLGAPAAAAAAARQSVTAGLAVAAHLPPAVQGATAHAARRAFTDGLSAGSVVAAAAAATAAAAALAFLPARARRPRPGSAPTTVPVRTRSPGQGAAQDRRHSPARLPSRPAPRTTAPR